MVKTRRWNRVEYHRMIETCIFRPDDRLELLDGLLVVKEPPHTPHATAIGLAGDALRATFGHGWSVRIQLPIALDPDSEPEPDIAVVSGTPRDYLRDHPARPALIIEVAGASLRLDRTRKSGLYARAGIRDYWVVNLVDRVLEVYRDPTSFPSSRHGWRYATATVLPPAAFVTPLAAPDARIAVADLLP